MGNASDTKKRCPALIAAGIEDPDSEEGTLFCAGSRHGQAMSQCPYPCCIVFEAPAENIVRKDARIKWAKKLNDCNVSIKDIALILGVSEATVKKYLKK